MSYEKQVSLLIDLLNIVQETNKFALKGGTAINLFYQEMPRLSVDIDLVYLPMTDRSKALQDINDELKELAASIETRMPGISISHVPTTPPDNVRQLLCALNGIRVKIEVNIVIRGVLYPTQTKVLCTSAQKAFGKYAEALVVSESDLYGSKICAALDRQHPRDLFDMMLYLQHHTITKDLKNAFLFYLLSHNRPIAEVLKPTRLDLSTIYTTDFVGMTAISTDLEGLYQTRELLIQSIYQSLTPEDKEFILSFKSGDPQWDLCDNPAIKDMPSSQWKLINIQNMRPEKRQKAYDNLKEVLSSL
jgi:predicted nucleotidyltransferase component of viral defense system